MQNMNIEQSLQGSLLSGTYKTFAVAHSRQKNASCTNAPWIQMTKRILSQHDTQNDILIGSAGMLHYDLVLRCWLNMGGCCKVVLRIPFSKWPEHRQWLYKWLENNDQVYLSCIKRLSSGQQQKLNSRNAAEIRDKAILTEADMIEAGSVRQNGRMHQLLSDQRRRGTYIVNRRLTRLEKTASETYKPGHKAINGCMDGFENYVWHLTRSRFEPWPNETMGEYLDNLLGIGQPAPYSAQAVLNRIIDKKRIVSASKLIRGGFSVVCFTGIKRQNLPMLFTWQNHLGRHRFEPWGIGIRKETVEKYTILPALYGPVDIYNRLPQSMKWRFQKYDRTTPQWAVELEWRHLGDLDLVAVNPSDMAVLTPMGVVASGQPAARAQGAGLAEKLLK
jgi:hypothetical protein